MKELITWVNIPEDSDFSIYNLPFGIFSTASLPKRTGMAIGQFVIDLSALHHRGFFDALNMPSGVFEQAYLNDFISLGKTITSKVRKLIQEALCDQNSPLRSWPEALLMAEDLTMHLPVRVGDYTDFYSSEEHATNVGKMFRDPDNALLPNWKHMPVGYHGRASSIIVSGVPVRRPCGQTKPTDGPPVFGPSNRLDFELEMGFIVGKDTTLGSPVNVLEAEEYIFGLVLFNDWSARDIQKWEYVPLGPFLGKSFASSVSPWVVTLDALEPFRVSGPAQDPEPLPYLRTTGSKNYNIDLEVALQPKNGQENVICRSNLRHLYWNMSQQLAHHTVNGCNIRVGDMMASGTISGPTPDSFGSMLELSWAGKRPIELSDGSTRSFIHDGDSIIMRGIGRKEFVRVGFGEVRSEILPAELS